jgi:RNA polymerase sigma factor (sigma-70 family)
VDIEQQLWETYWADPSPAGGEAETALFQHYRPLIRQVRGRAFSGADASYSITPEDLEQYGALGLLEAIGRYRPERGRFESYANAYCWGRMMHGLKECDLTPKSLAAKGERWHAEPVEGPGPVSGEGAEHGRSDGKLHPALVVGSEEEMVSMVAASLQAQVLAACIDRLPARRRRTAREHLLGGREIRELARAFHLPARRVKREILPATRGQLQGLLQRAGAVPGAENSRIFPAISGSTLFFFSEGSEARGRPRGRPPGRTRTVRLGHRVTPAAREQLRRLAAREGRSEADLLMEMIAAREGGAAMPPGEP